jgi:hypothetical protein
MHDELYYNNLCLYQKLLLQYFLVASLKQICKVMPIPEFSLKLCPTIKTLENIYHLYF